MALKLHFSSTHFAEQSDEDLMLAFCQGESHAFNELLKRHQKGVYNFLNRQLGQTQNADEAFQEVFVRVVRAKESYSPSAKFTTWLYTIARNYCVDQIRKARFRQTVPIAEEHDDGEPLGEYVVHHAESAEKKLAFQQVMQHLERAMQQINPDQREVFVLREVQHLPFEEIATIVGASTNTVKSRMRYALLALRTELEKVGLTNLSVK